MGKHLKAIDRGKIEILFKQHKTTKEIAKELQVSERTIYREKKRGKVIQLDTNYKPYYTYSANYAQLDYNYKQTGKQKALKIDTMKQIIPEIEHKIIKDKKSPYVVIQELKIKYKNIFSLSTLYNYIRSDQVFLNINKRKLPYKKHITKNKVKKTIPKNPFQLKIKDRPVEINKREKLGNWEIDTLISQRQKGKIMLVLTERKTRYQLIYLLEEKNISSVNGKIQEIQKLLNTNYKELFKTFTTDNGSEFLRLDEIHKLTYYCDPFCSYQKGTVENNNKLIRRYYPKKISTFENLTEVEIKELQEKINNYPRKIFDGKTSKQKMIEELKINNLPIEIILKL